jgi:hypothetical protein
MIKLKLEVYTRPKTKNTNDIFCGKEYLIQAYKSFNSRNARKVVFGIPENIFTTIKLEDVVGECGDVELIGDKFYADFNFADSSAVYAMFEELGDAFVDEFVFGSLKVATTTGINIMRLVLLPRSEVMSKFEKRAATIKKILNK